MQSRLEEFTHLATSTATSKLMAFKLHVSAHNLFSQLWTHPTHRLVILAPEAHLPVSPADGFLGCELAAAHHLRGPEGWPWPHCLLMRVSPCAEWPLSRPQPCACTLEPIWQGLSPASLAVGVSALTSFSSMPSRQPPEERDLKLKTFSPP